MHEVFEISERYIEPGDANDLLYEPVANGLTYRRTRRYEFEIEGDARELERFARSTLFDEVSQQWHQGKNAALEGSVFGLDYGMKPGALDLEKEAIIAHYREIKNPGFELKNLEIRQRIYAFGESPGDNLSDRFVRDICNGAIHNWKVI